MSAMAKSEERLRLVSDADNRLREIIATLEESRAALAESANPEAAQILAIAILQLQMRLHRVASSELRALAEAVTTLDTPEKHLASVRRNIESVVKK
jgi:uncharacterized protein YgbK (DUF1537 family)